MEIEVVEDFAEKTGKKISDEIALKYGDNPVVEHKSFFVSFWDELLDKGVSRLKVKKEIYERALHESAAFFINHGDAKFDDKIIGGLKSHLGQRVENVKTINELSPEQALASIILIYVNDLLLDEGVAI